MKKINVGCGLDIKPKSKGWINLDQHDKNGADVIFNLDELFKKGGKMPFPDNHFDYVYCSHVLEDFIEPMVLIKEFIRICKIGGRIELRAPFEPNLHLTNIHHKIPFTLFKFRSIVRDQKTYGRNYPLKIETLCYYNDKNRGRIYNLFSYMIESFYNGLSYKIVERTFIKYLFAFVNCRVVYRKLPKKGGEKL